MSIKEMWAIEASGTLSRGGRDGDHFVSDAISNDALRARQRLALKDTPEVRVTLEVPSGTFGPASKVGPLHGMPGGGTERTASGANNVPARIVNVHVYK